MSNSLTDNLPLQERIKDRVTINKDGCWVWNLKLERTGYARVRIAGRTMNAHRISYENFIGKIPDGLQIDHLCRNRACVNPYHLEPVTGRENKYRSSLKKLWEAKKQQTHCIHGHEYTTENTYLKRDLRWGGLNRNCRECHRTRNRNFYRKMRGLSYAT